MVILAAVLATKKSAFTGENAVIHASTTDKNALLAKKGPGKEAHLSYMGHTVMKNRNGLIVKTVASQATGKAE